MSAAADFHLCVLIVDDDAGILEISRRQVIKAFPTAVVTTACGGQEAMACLLRARRQDLAPVPMPDLVLLDINMPEVDGFEVLTWVRRNPDLSGLKVVMLTSSGAEQDIKRAAQLGADGYLIKFPHPAVLACLLTQVGNGIAAAVR